MENRRPDDWLFFRVTGDGICIPPPLTATRFHLPWVGSSIPARPRPTKDGQPYQSQVRLRKT